MAPRTESSRRRVSAKNVSIIRPRATCRCAGRRPPGRRAGLASIPRGDVQPLGIERTILVGDQHDAFDAVDPDQETDLFDQGLFFAKRGEVAGEAGCRPARPDGRSAAAGGRCAGSRRSSHRTARRCSRWPRRGCGSRRTVTRCRTRRSCRGRACSERLQADRTTHCVQHVSLYEPDDVSQCRTVLGPFSRITARSRGCIARPSHSNCFARWIGAEGPLISASSSLPVFS